MESKTFIQLNTLPAGYNGFAMTADFRVQRKILNKRSRKLFGEIHGRTDDGRA